jgi:hypothetical protein
MKSSQSFPSFLEWGDGDQTVVSLHYFGGSALSWQWVVEELAADIRCIALNLPGFGTAPLDTIQQEGLNYLPTAHLVKTSGVGHLIPLECPGLITQTVRQPRERH